MENEIRYFSMFTGVGGFELGLDYSPNDNRSDREAGQFKGVYQQSKSSKSGFRCFGFSEIDKYANQLLQQKFPNVKNYGDASKIDPRELPEFDMLCGGFPCQAFSIAGKRRGFEDTRGTMFFEIARILEVKRPKVVLLENVKGLLNHEKGKTFAVILQTLAELGYRTQWMVLNSKFFGVPQNRERVFIIGSLRGERRPEILPFGRGSQQTINKETSSVQANTLTSTCYKGAGNDGISIIQLVGGSQGKGVYSTDGTSTTLAAQGGGKGCKTGLYAVLTPDRETKRQNGRRFKENGEPSFTLTGQDIHGVTDGVRIRRLTPTECERLQGFPDGWTDGFSDTQRYKMMGNAVTVNVIKAIGQRLVAFYGRERCVK